MKTIGIVLVALGLIALVYGAIDYRRDDTLLKIGSAEISTGENRNMPIPLVGGGVVLLGGIALLVAQERREPHA